MDVKVYDLPLCTSVLENASVKKVPIAIPSLRCNIPSLFFFSQEKRVSFPKFLEIDLKFENLTQF